MGQAKRALITGITGQDGSYLAEFLLEKGYTVFGMVRRASRDNFDRLEHIRHRLELRQADLLDQLSLIRLLEESRPHEVYNLAAQSFVPTVVEPARAHRRVHGARRHADARGDPARRSPTIRFYQASSSEMFGKVRETPQTERTPFHPRSPYGVAKVYGHSITVNYRESYGIFACSGILFNHESPRRGLEFVTRKVTDGVGAHQATGWQARLRLGNLDACRDWGFAGDYVQAMWLMLQQEQPGRLRGGHGRERTPCGSSWSAAFGHVGLDWREARRGRPDAEAAGRGGRAARRRDEGAADARLGAEACASPSWCR